MTAGGLGFCFVLSYEKSKSFDVNMSEFIDFSGFVFCILACLVVFVLGYILVSDEEPPAKKQPPAPQKEPIVQADMTLFELHVAISRMGDVGVYADEIPDFLQADFKAFMVGKTMQTEGHRSCVYPADMKLYAKKLFTKGIDYPVQFKTE